MNTTEYTSFNKVSKISNDTATLEIYYGSDLQRHMDKYYVRGVLKKTKYYVGSIYEQEEDNTLTTNNITETNYIQDGGGAIVATHVIKNNVGKSFYWFKDHLGSLTTITDGTGNVVQTLSFDAWGKRRNSDWTTIPDGLIGAFASDRGFTGHQHYDLFSLVNMNGRIYDPVIGRFLSADPMIQDLSELQNLNRYAYVINNPLKYTDPTGYSFWSFISKPFVAAAKAVSSVVSTAAKAVGTAASAVGSFVKENIKTIAIVTVAIAVGAVTGGAGTVALLGGGAWGTFGAAVLSGGAAGFASSFTASILNGQNIGNAVASSWKGAAIGAVSAGLTFGVGSIASSVSNETFNIARTGIKVVGHGIVQGGISLLNGGKFIHGFESGAISGATADGIGYLADGNKVLQVTAAAVVGGTTSAIGGGNFANGAITGAYVTMFNDWMHPTTEGYGPVGEKEDQDWFDKIQRGRNAVIEQVGKNSSYGASIERFTLGSNIAISTVRAAWQIGTGNYLGATTTGLTLATDFVIGATMGSGIIPGVAAMGAAYGVEYTVNYLKDHPGTNSFLGK